MIRINLDDDAIINYTVNNNEIITIAFEIPRLYQDRLMFKDHVIYIGDSFDLYLNDVKLYSATIEKYELPYGIMARRYGKSMSYFEAVITASIKKMRKE